MNKGEEELRNEVCLTFEELRLHLKEKSFGYIASENNKLLIDIIKKYQNEIMAANNSIELDRKKELYPKNIVERITKDFIDAIIGKNFIRLINLTYQEFLELNKESLERKYIEITISEMMKLCEWKRENSYDKVEKYFSKTDIKLIYINNGNDGRKIYLSKTEYNKLLSFLNKLKTDYIKVADISEVVIKTGHLNRNNIPYIMFKNSAYIRLEDKEKIVKTLLLSRAKREADTFYERFKRDFEALENKEKNNYPKFNEIFFSFSKHKSSRNKTIVNSTRNFNLYKGILECIEKDFDVMNLEELNELMLKVTLKLGGSRALKLEIIEFNNYLKNKFKYSVTDITDKSRRVPLECYDADVFIDLLAKLIEVVADKNKIKKMYRNWQLSTAVTYIFMHYTVAWRKMDLIEQLPTADLRHVTGSDDGMEFIKWLENGNELSDYQAFQICEDLEVITNRLRKKARKNEQELFCVITPGLSKSIATLLCICEANKQIHKHFVPAAVNLKFDGVFHADSTEPANARRLIRDAFDIDISEVLKEPFNNKKMNKSFLQLVKEKAEELDLACSYYVAQISRGHAPTNACYAEMTKIYLKKDISKASLRAFAIGTMGCVQHIMLELLDNEYKNLNYLEQIEAIKQLDITPYTLENNLAKTTEKMLSMKLELENYFRNNGDFEELLNKFLYAQNCYGIERGSKCLLKITRDGGAITRIETCGSRAEKRNKARCPRNLGSCIGCDYLIALRYFIYEFNKKMNVFMDEWENCETELDADIYADAYDKIYIPAIKDLTLTIGKEAGYIYDRERAEKVLWGE